MAEAEDEEGWKMQLRRLLDVQLLGGNRAELVVNCVEVLVRLCTNLLAASPPADAHRTIRARNPRIQATLLQAEGGVDLLLHLSFRKRVQDFQEVYTYTAETGLAERARLRWAAGVLHAYLARARAIVQEGLSNRALTAAAEERAYRARILQAIQGDREERREREAARQAARTMVPTAGSGPCTEDQRGGGTSGREGDEVTPGRGRLLGTGGQGPAPPGQDADRPPTTP